MFPGFVSLLYLVAPFWDTSFGNGIISYEIYESGYVLDTVSAFIRQRNPSNFQGTWMMVAFWDSVRVYFSVFSTEVSNYMYRLTHLKLSLHPIYIGKQLPGYSDNRWA